MHERTVEREKVQQRPQALRVRRAAAFSIAAAVVLVLAIDDGGYDVVTRDQLGLVVWAAIALGFAFGVLPRGLPTPPAWVAVGAAAGLAALTALSLTWTESDGRTFTELARVLQYAGLVALAYSALNRHTWGAAAAGLAAAALVIPALSLVARLAPDLITDDAARFFETDRLSYPFGYWNAVACWGSMAIAIGLAWSAHARYTVTRALALAAVPVAALAVYLTYSRAGVIAVAVAVVAVITLSRNRWTATAHTLVAALASAPVLLAARGEEQIARATGDEGAGAVLLVLVLAAVACLAVAAMTRITDLDEIRMPQARGRFAAGLLIWVALVGLTLAHAPITDAWDEFRNDRAVASGEDPATRLTTFGGTRYEVWSTAIDGFESDRVRGAGPGSFEFVWSREGEGPEFVLDAHSLYLEMLAELGVPGLALTLLLLTALLVAALAARQRLDRDFEIGAWAAATAAFVVFLVYAGVDWMWELSAIGALAIGGIAVTGAAGFERWGRQPLSTGPRIAIVLAAVAAGAVQVPELVSTERLRASAAELVNGSADRAAELADESVRAESWAAAPYVQRALVEQQRGDLDEARRDLQRAIEKEPTNWRHHLLLARLEAEAGDRAAVKAQLAEVRRLAPRSLFLIPNAPQRGEIDAVLQGGPPKAPARSGGASTRRSIP